MFLGECLRVIHIQKLVWGKRLHQPEPLRVAADDRAAAPGADAMMVTPRDIDAVIDRGAKTLSFSINAALQPQLSLEDIVYLTS